jgi:hypothetical protein
VALLIGGVEMQAEVSRREKRGGRRGEEDS